MSERATRVVVNQMEDYERLRLLGDGGQGKVYHARHRKSGKEHALKVMACKDSNQVNAALKEIKVLIQMRHPNIVSYSDFFMHFESPSSLALAAEGGSGVAVCLLMELCKQGTLADRIKHCKARFMCTGEHCLTESTIRMWARDCAEALRYIHGRGFLHRDMKPSNIFFDAEDDDVKLGDFGLATAAQTVGVTSHVGTPYYFAPELLLRQPYNDRVDVWGLGVVLLELLTLRERPVNSEVLASPQSVDTVVDDITTMGFSTGVGRLVRDMLRGAPNERPTPDEILARLAALDAADRGSTPDAASGLPPVCGPPRPVAKDAALAPSTAPSSPTHLPRPTREVVCEMCGVYAAVVTCAACDDECYCGPCDAVKHRNQRRREHARAALDADLATTPTDAGAVSSRPGSAASFPAAPPPQQVRTGSFGSDVNVNAMQRAGSSGDYGKEQQQQQRRRASVTKLDMDAVPEPVAPPSGRTSACASRGTSPTNEPMPSPTAVPAQLPTRPARTGGAAPERRVFTVGASVPQFFAALDAAAPGSTITIAAGFVCTEHVKVRTPGLTIVGEGSGAARPLFGTGQLVGIAIAAPDCKLVNLRVAQDVPPRSATDRPFGILVNCDGCATIDQCDATAHGNAIGVQGAATDAAITRCTLHHAKQAGVYVFDQARATMRECTITECDFAGVLLKKRACGHILSSTIAECPQTGIFFHGECSGVVEQNSIKNNRGCGIVLKGGAEPAVRRNQVANSQQVGIFCCENSRGDISDNVITGSCKAGIIIKTGAHPTVVRNTVTNGKETGIYVFESGSGHIEDNDVRQNGGAGVLVTSGGDPRVVRNRIQLNQYEGVWVCKQGRGYFEDNDLRRNAKGPKDLQGCWDDVRWVNNREK